MKKLIALFVLVLALAVVASAQETMGGKKKAAKPKKVTLTGNIIDKMCSAKMTSAEAATGHKKGCSLSERCAKSGFGVYADGKYYAFDEAGNGLAKAALEKSGAESGATFKVEGTVSEDTLTVAKIKEVVAKK